MFDTLLASVGLLANLNYSQPLHSYGHFWSYVYASNGKMVTVVAEYCAHKDTHIQIPYMVKEN